jgi:hypothetical protein
MDKRSSLKKQFQSIEEKYPDATPAIKPLFKVLCNIEDLVGFTPALLGQSGEWAAIISSAEESCENYCKALRGKTLFSTLYRTYTVTLNELKAVLKINHHTGQPKIQDKGFKEV